MNEAPQLPGVHAAARVDGHAAALQEPMLRQHHYQSYNQPPQASMTAPRHAGATNNWAAEFTAFNANSFKPNPQAGQLAAPHHPASQMPFQPRHFPGAPTPYSGMSAAYQPVMQQGVSQENAHYAPLYSPANGQVDPQTGAVIRDDADDEFQTEMDAWMRANGTNGFSAGDMADIDAELAAVAREHGESETQDAAAVEDPNAIMTEIANETDAAARRDATVAALREQLDLQSSLDQMSLTDLARQELASLPQTEEAPAATESLAESSTTAVEDARTRNQSEIAEAAGRLLDSVSHERGEKFTNSNFLALMRDFHSGSKTIVDGKVVDADGEPSSHDGKGSADSGDAGNAGENSGTSA